MTKIQSSPLPVTMAAATQAESENLPQTEKQTIRINALECWKVPTAAIARFNEAMEARKKIVEAHESEINKNSFKTRFSRMINIWFPPKYNEIIVNKISNTLEHSNVREQAKALSRFKKSYPAELRVALPGIKLSDIKRIANSLVLNISCQVMLVGLEYADLDLFETYLNRTVKYLKRSGVEETNESFKQFKSVFEEALKIMREEAAEKQTKILEAAAADAQEKAKTVEAA